MTQDPTTIPQESTLLEAFELLRRGKHRRLPVIRAKRLAGIVSVSDTYRFIDPACYKGGIRTADRNALAAITLDTVMKTQVAYIEPDAHVGEAAALMNQRKVGFLPVLNNRTLVGVLTDSNLFDVIRNIFCPDEGRLLKLPISQEQHGDAVARVAALAQEHSVDLRTLVMLPDGSEQMGYWLSLRALGGNARDFCTACTEVIAADQTL